MRKELYTSQKRKYKKDVLYERFIQYFYCKNKKKCEKGKWCSWRGSILTGR